MTTAKRARETIGRKGLWALGKMAEDVAILVEVVDVREVFGREQWQVKPVQGSGRRWVEAVRVTLVGP